MSTDSEMAPFLTISRPKRSQIPSIRAECSGLPVRTPTIYNMLGRLTAPLASRCDPLASLPAIVFGLNPSERGSFHENALQGRVDNLFRRRVEFGFA